MDNIIKEPPPWTTVKWVKSPPWTHLSVPIFSYDSWISNERGDITEVKDTIGLIDKNHKWEIAKKMVNLYELIYTHNDTYLPPSLSLDNPLSRSYFKLIEIISILKFFNNKDVKLKTAHIAEGPGGFIQAIHTLASKNKKNIISSIAMTLKSTTSQIPGWKKANTFLNKHKQVNIHYGEDGTGDVYNISNQASFISKTKSDINLFTADGGFDFSIDYSSQEHSIYHLLVCSSIIGLQVLAQGGSFVLKIFDCNSQHTLNLIILIGRCFKEWTLYKPAITRPCNSERYFIGKDFRGIIPECLAALKEVEKQSKDLKYPLFTGEICSDEERSFFNEHINKSIDRQLNYINHAIRIADNPDIWWSEWITHCVNKSALWCDTFRVMSHPLREYMRILHTKYPIMGQKPFCTL
jgi:23S rRNA U2552 (ribose-2'-O)-methylase RlmE/FtsJ